MIYSRLLFALALLEPAGALLTSPRVSSPLAARGAAGALRMQVSSPEYSQGVSTAMDFQRMLKSDLQQKCMAAGLPTDGTKAELVSLLTSGAGSIAPTHQFAPLSIEEVKAAQDSWANAIMGISHTYLTGGDYITEASNAAAELYGYGHSEVLFKPTKAAEVPFRPTGEGAMSYFVGGDVVDGGLEEDHGFAINGGKGWSNVGFDNHHIDIKGNVAISMGTYYFTCATTGDVSRVEYTFGYERCADGKPRIFLHHSSLPYAPSGTVLACDDEEETCEIIEMAPLTHQDVQAAQDAWANAIVSISKACLDGGDYVTAAANAAGELYGYGHSDVLFKPTKATSTPFRPTGEGAMSYFVGANAVAGGYEEDAGFAINGGKGWSNVVFDNHHTDYSGNVAISMGTYYFTCATTGDVSRVEYTFGYKRCTDGKPRIFLHHSSIPYEPH
jgi:hypothetical protein